MFYERERINEYLIVVFIKEILNDNEREEYYGPYDISVQRPLSKEELRPVNYVEFLTQAAKEDLFKSFDIKFDKDTLKYKPEIQNLDKYFNGPDGLIERLKDVLVDIDDFDKKYKDDPEYRSQRLRLLFLFYYIEKRLDFSESFNTVNTALMLKKTTMENADLTLVDIKNTNGVIYHELRERLFLGIDPAKSFEIKQEINSTIQGFKKWLQWCNVLMYGFDEQYPDYFQKIYEDIPTAPDCIQVYKGETSLFEAVYLKLHLNESIGRETDFINLYDEIIALPINEPSSITISEYNKYKSEYVENSVNKIDELFTKPAEFKKLCLLVFDNDNPDSDDKKRLKRSKSAVIGYIRFLKENSDNPSEAVKLIEIASCLRIYLSDDPITVPNFFFRHSTNKAQKSIHTELRNHEGAYEKNQIATVELVRWQTFILLGFGRNNIKYYFKSMQRIDELLLWTLTSNDTEELKRKREWTDENLKKITELDLKPCRD